MNKIIDIPQYILDSAYMKIRKRFMVKGPTLGHQDWIYRIKLFPKTPNKVGLNGEPCVSPAWEGLMCPWVPSANTCETRVAPAPARQKGWEAGKAPEFECATLLLL
jgi:hypothetical protein